MKEGDLGRCDGSKSRERRKTPETQPTYPFLYIPLATHHQEPRRRLPRPPLTGSNPSNQSKL